MILDLVTYLLKEMGKYEVKGIESETNKLIDQLFIRLNNEKEAMIRPVIEEFFARLEFNKEIALRQLAKMMTFIGGLMVLGIGVAFALDELIMFKGAGFVIVGFLIVIVSYMMRL